MTQPRVVFVTSGLARGGAELQLVQLVSGLVADGWPVSVVTLQPGGVYQPAIENAGVPVLEFPCGRVTGPTAVFRLASKLRLMRPDVVHTHAFRANLWGRLAAINAGIPVVASVRATYSYLPAAYYPVERWLSRRSAGVVTPALATTRHLTQVVGVPATKVITIPNGVDLNLFSPRRSGTGFRHTYGLDDRFVVLAPGRLSAQKDHPLLFAAFRTLLRAVASARLIVVGTGPLEAKLRKSVADLGDVVVFTGDLDRLAMADAMAASDCVCLCTRYEGMPNVLLEAMAAGRPSVSTATDGVVEVIRHEIDGFVTRSGDTEAMAAALICLASAPDLRARMGTAARLRAETEYTIAMNLAKHAAVFCDAACGGGRALTSAGVD